MRQIIWAYPRAYLSLWTLPPFSHHRDSPPQPTFLSLLVTATADAPLYMKHGSRHIGTGVTRPTRWSSRSQGKFDQIWSQTKSWIIHWMVLRKPILQLWGINTMGSSSRGSGSWRFWRVNNWGTWTLGTPKSTSQFESSVPLLFDGHISQSWRQTLCPNMSEYEYLSENLPKDLSVDLKKSQSNQNQHGYLFTYRDNTYHG